MQLVLEGEIAQLRSSVTEKNDRLGSLATPLCLIFSRNRLAHG